MEILTLVILLVVLGLVIRRRRKDQEIERSNLLQAQVRLRARLRALESSKHENDPYHMGIDFNTVIETTELDDMFDGRPALTAKQKETIELIFKEHKSTPISMKAFNESDVTETIVLDGSWIKKT